MSFDIVSLVFEADTKALVEAEEAVKSLETQVESLRAAMAEKQSSGGFVNSQELRQLEQATNGLSEAQQAAAAASAAMQAKGVALGTAIGGVVAQGIMKGAEKLYDWVAAAMQAADRTYTLSQRLGIAAEDVAGLELAFKSADISTNQMQMAISRLQAEASKGSEAMARLGISTKNADGSMKSGKQLLVETAEAFSRHADGAEKSAIATEMFGQRLGLFLLPLLNEGAAGFAKAEEAAQKFGLTISSETAQAGDKLDDALTQLGATVDAIPVRIVDSVLPALADMAEEFANSDALAGALTVTVELLGAAMDLAVSFVDGLTTSFVTIGKAIGGVLAFAVALMKIDLLSGKGWSEAKAAISSAADDISSMWERAGARINKTFEGVQQGSDKTGAAAQALGADTSKSTQQFDKWVASLKSGATKIAETTAAGGKLSRWQEAQNELARKVTSSTERLTEAQVEQAAMAINAMRVAEQAAEKLKEQEKAKKEAATQTERASKAAAAEAKAVEAATDKLFRTLGNAVIATNNASSAEDKLAAAMKARLSIAQSMEDSDGRISGAVQANVLAVLDYQVAIAQAAVAEEQWKAAAAESTDQWLKMEADARASAKSLEDRALALEQDNVAMAQSISTGRELSIVVDELALARARENLQLKMSGAYTQELIDAAQREVTALERIIAAKNKGSDLKKAKDAWSDYGKRIEKVNDEIAEGLTDSLFRAFEAGKGFFETLWEGIKNTFKTTILRLMIEPVQNTIRGILGVAMGSSGTGAMAQANNLYSGASMLSTAYSNYGTYGSIFGAGGIFGTNAAYGAAIGTTNIGAGSQAAMLAAQTGEFGAAGTLATSQSAAGAGSGAVSWGGSAAGIAAGVAAGVYGGRAISGGYSTGGSGNSNVNMGTAIGAAIGTAILPGLGTAIGAALGGVAGGLVNRAFGRKAPEVTGAGVMGTIGGGDFTGEEFIDYKKKGGWFRSDKNWTDKSAIDPAIEKFFDSASASVLEQATKFGEALGLPGEKLKDITTDIRVNITENVEDNKKAIEAALATYGDALVNSWADAVAPLAVYGETTAQTIERVATAILQINSVLDLIGVTALESSVAGGQAATALADVFGGLDNLGSAVSAYYNEYFTQEEKAANLTRSVTEAFARYGAEVPATRDAFMELVETRDLETEAGRQEFAALMSVAGAFAALHPATNDAAEALKSFNSAMDSIAGTTASLEVDLLRAQGDETGAKAMERSQFVANIDPKMNEEQRAAVVAGYDYIQMLRSQIDAVNDAREAGERLAEATASATLSLMSAEDAVRTQFEGIAESLSDLGIDVTVEQLMAASKADILAFAQSFSQLTGVSDDAKTSVWTLAEALGGLVDSADQAAEETRIALENAMDSARMSLMDADQALTYQFEKIKTSLSSLGFDVSIEQLTRATKQDILAFAETVNSLEGVSSDTKTAIWNLAESLGGLKDAVNKVDLPNFGNTNVSQADIKSSASAMLFLQEKKGIADMLRAGTYSNTDIQSKYNADYANFNRPGASASVVSGRADLWAQSAMVLEAANEQMRAIKDANHQRLYAEQAARRGQSGGSYDDSKRDELLQKQVDGTQDLIDSLDKLRSGIIDLREDLLGSALDPRNPTEKYLSEKAALSALGSEAVSTGDTAAIEEFKTRATEFLQLSQSYNASTQGYAVDFSGVIATLNEIDKKLAAQQATAQATLKVQQAGLGEIAETSAVTAKATTAQTSSWKVFEQRAVE